MAKEGNKRVKWVRISLGVVGVAAAAIGYGFAWRTFVQWWEPVAWSIGIGAALGLWSRGAFGRMLGVGSRKLSALIATMFIGAVCYGALMSINYCFAVEESSHDEVAVVTAKYSEERTRYRRLSRNRMVPSGKYMAYYIKVEFDNGAKRDMPVNASVYRSTRVGQQKHFEVRKGFFGYSVFK